MQKERIDWIDTLKGIGIILVILGHAPAINIRGYIFSFHMPLFFFISGFLFQMGKNQTFFSFLKRKVKSLLIPYVSFSIISILSNTILLESYIQIKPTIKAFFVSTRNHIPFNEVLWFLTCMFLIEIMFYIVSKISKSDWLKLAIVLLLYFVGFKFFNINDPKLPWNFDSSLFYILYYGIGYLFKKWNIPNHRMFSSISIVCLMINFVQLIRPDVFYQFLYKLHLGLIFTVIVPTMISIIAFIEIAKLTSQSNKLRYLGQNSLSFFSLHIPVAFPIIYKCFQLLNINVTASQTANVSNILGLIFLIVTILILLPLIKAVNKYFPFILGKFDIKTSNVDTVRF